MRRYIRACLTLGFSIAVNSLSYVNAEDYLIRNATVHTATARGAVHHTDVLVRDGVIIQVGQNIAKIKGVAEIDGTNKHLTPGLINAATHIGLVEIGAVANTNDDVTSAEGFGASFNIAAAINYQSTVIPQNRINGLTRAIVIPGDGNSIFSGQGSILALHSSQKGLLNDYAVQVASLGINAAEYSGGSRAVAFQLLDTALTEAKYLRQNEARFPLGSAAHFSQSLADLKSLYAVVTRKVPLMINANRRSDIHQAIQLAKKHTIKVIIVGGAEAWTVAADLAKANIPVMLDPIQNMPQFDSLAVRLDGASRLYRAGVKLMFTGGGTHNGYLVRQSAGNAVAHGLPADAALEAMTINTAEVFEIANYGQIKPKMQADLVLWDGDPLEVTSNPDLVLIQGEHQPLVSRATRLRDRYWALKGNHQQAYQH